MHELLPKFHSSLKKAGHSITKSRDQVFLALVDQEPLRMSELVHRLEPTIDRATIYRTVSLLESLGIIEKLIIGWKYKLELSHEYSGHHHHLTCIDCGVVVDIQGDKQTEKMLHSLARMHGFDHESHQLEIRGKCSVCRVTKK
jgi:Fur family transcriptional regulator, ferric uptake regulator